MAEHTEGKSLGIQDAIQSDASTVAENVQGEKTGLQGAVEPDAMITAKPVEGENTGLHGAVAPDVSAIAEKTEDENTRLHGATEPEASAIVEQTEGGNTGLHGATKLEASAMVEQVEGENTHLQNTSESEASVRAEQIQDVNTVLWNTSEPDASAIAQQMEGETTGVQGAIEPDIPFVDEGFAESSTSSFVSSIASEIRQGTVENGRVYAAYGNHEYGLPVDDHELDRLDMNHHKYTLLQNNKLFLAPITPMPQKILDLGTGTGIFAIDIADMYPSESVLVIGTDIAPIQPQWVPPNCQFEIEDAESDWTFQENSFDYIHGRDFYQSIRDWRRLVRQSFEHLKPGGYFELACVWPMPGCDDETLPKDCAYVEVCQTFQDIGAKIKADPDAPLHYHEYLNEAGFVNVVQTILKIPTSPWPKDKRLKKVGALELMNLTEGAQGFLLRGYTKEFGKTREELELLLMRMRKELTMQKYHSYVSYVVVYGQKPEGAS